MKKIFSLLLVLLMIAGCATQSKHQKNDDIYEFAEIMATGYLENVLGYNPEAKYSLHKIKADTDEPSYVYQVTKDNEAILLIKLAYSDEVAYGGMCFDYGDGYLISTVKDKYFRIYESDEYLYSVSLNPEMEYKDYRDVVVTDLDENHDQEVMDKVISYLSTSDSMLPEGVACNEGDLIQLGTPILTYGIELNEENKTIEVNQYNLFIYPVYINSELQCFADATYHEEGSGFGFMSVEAYPQFSANEKFIRVTTKGAYHKEFFVTENGDSNPELKYPLYVDKALESLLDIVKDSDLSTEIVAARYIESAGFNIENSVNPEAYKAVVDFVEYDYNGTVKIVDEDILYDPDYNVVGYNYALTYYGGGTGHAIVVKKGASYIVNEASYGENPYEGLSKDVIKVYAGPFGYLYYLDNGMLMNLRTNEEVDPANVRRYKVEDE